MSSCNELFPKKALVSLQALLLRFNSNEHVQADRPNAERVSSNDMSTEGTRMDFE
jgi:hypothetical protein